MNKRPYPDSQRCFHDDGYYFPVSCLASEEAHAYRLKLERFEAERGGPLTGKYRHKMHLLLTWVNELMRHSRILDAVEEILGPDILCWNTNFFIKEPRSPDFISWHQDATYWGLDNNCLQVAAWLALSPSNVDSGCMRIIPGTHKRQLEHVDTYAANNMLQRGQHIAEFLDESRAVNLVLEPGEISLHHVLIAHSSNPNSTADRRIGIAMRYVSPRIKQHGGFRDSATLVRGSDHFGNFEMEPRPKRDMEPHMIALHSKITSAHYEFETRLV